MKDDAKPVEEAMLAEARVEISYADHKASMLLAALGVGFGAVIGGLLAGDWKPSDQGDGEFLWWIGAVLAVGSVALAAGAVWPRFSRRGSGTDLFFWGDVAAISTYDELVKRLDDSPPPAENRTRSQLWVLSRIVATKYWFVRGAVAAAGLAVLAFAFSAALA